MEWEPSITIEEKFYGHNAVVYCSKILIYGGITKKNGLTEFVNPNQLFYFDTGNIIIIFIILGLIIIV